MAQESCPFCKSTVNADAEVCHSCGAQKGYDRAGQSKHVAGWIALFVGGLTYFAYTAGDELLFFFSLFTGFVTLWLLSVWFHNLSNPPKWFRTNENYRS